VVRSHVGIGSREPSPSNDIFPSWYVQPKGSSNSSSTVDLVSNKLATSCTPDIAKKTEGGGNDNIFSSDSFVGGGGGNNAGTTQNDDIHNCNDSKPSVTLTTPTACASVADCVFTVTVSQGTHVLSGGKYTASPAGTLALSVNGQSVTTVGIPSDHGDVWTYSYNYTPGGAGNISVQAQAIDSVLYTGGSDTKTVTIGGH
jgi:hypothetical protein